MTRREMMVISSEIAAVEYWYHKDGEVNNMPLWVRMLILNVESFNRYIKWDAVSGKFRFQEDAV